MVILHRLVCLVASELSLRRGFRKSIQCLFSCGRMVSRPPSLGALQWQNGSSMAAVSGD